MTYFSTKTFGNDRGLSCAFRQWKADSHCSFVHGYALGFEFEFGAEHLDDTNWVYDFGNTKWIKEFLEDHFDHTLVVAADDPLLGVFKELDERHGADVLIMPDVGCEAFAKFVFDYVSVHVADQTKGRVTLTKVKVFEHAANSAGVYA